MRGATQSGNGFHAALWRVLPRACGVPVAALALVVLVGWFAGSDTLTEVLPGFAPMKVNAAVCFLLLAVVVLRSARGRVATVAASVVTALTALTLLEYAAGLEFGIDEALRQDPGFPGVANPQGRMAIATAIALCCLGCAALVLRRRPRLADVLLLPPLLLGGLTVLGYLYGVDRLHSVVGYTTMSIVTGVGILVCFVGVAVAVPGGQAQRLVLGETAGSLLLRRLVPVAVLVVPVLGLLQALGQEAGWYGTRFGIALDVLVTAGVLLVAAWMSADRLDGVDRARQEARAELVALNHRLEAGRDEATARAEALARDLEEQQARFSRAIANTDDLVWTVEVMPDRTYRLDFASSAAPGVLGGALPSGRDLRAAMAELVHPGAREDYEEFNERVIAGESAEVELRLTGVDGRERWLWMRGTPRAEGERLFSDGVVTDITERRQLAEQREHMLALEREQVARLRQLDSLREEFLAAAGHELRTPLAAIRGFAELLSADGTLPPRQRERAEVIARRSVQASGLINDMFELSSLSAGILGLHRERLALDEAVREAVDHHAPRGDGPEVTCDVEPVEVEADPLRIRQVLDNLLSNAVKYSPDGGHVVVRVRRLEDHASLTVSDEGIGIPAEDLPHVFDRLHRAGNVRDGDIPGTGLGLTLVKALVEAHDGTISVESAGPGRGTTFRVELPLALGAS